MLNFLVLTAFTLAIITTKLLTINIYNFLKYSL